MGILITIFHGKGGAGKTSTALSWADYLRTEGQPVAMADFDPQRTLTDVAQIAGDGAPPLLDFAPDPAELRRRSDYDFIVCDTPPFRLHRTLDNLLRNSTLIVVPVVPGVPDLIAAERTADLIAKVAPDQQACFLLNRVRHSMEKYIQEVREHLSTLGPPVLRDAIAERVVYQREAMTKGGVFQTTDTKAQAEVRAAAEESLRLLM